MLIEFNDIIYKYPNTETYLFKDLNCRVAGPGFHALFGPSGVGKTTLAKMIVGEINGFSGKIKVQDMANILYAYNLEKLPGWSGVGDHLADVTPRSGKGRLNDLVRSFGLQTCMGSRFSRLSMGQQNRVNLTRYLVQDFDLLVMDECLANVDEATREHIISKIKKIFPEKCFVYISHNLAEVSKFCQQILVLRDPRKSPQIMDVPGRNHIEGQDLERKALEMTMLEIAHAS